MRTSRFHRCFTAVFVAALFGLLAVELAVKLTAEAGGTLSHVLALGFFLASFIFVYRSFYGMRIVKAA